MPEHRVVVLDLDGVVNWRIPAQKAGIPLIGKHDPRRYTTPVEIYQTQDVDLNGHISFKSVFSGTRHLMAPVFPDVAKLIKGLDDTTIYGSTGRPNEKPMVYATGHSLEFAGTLDKFDYIYFRPKGYTTTEAKVAALADIRRWWDDEQIEVVDDNPGDLLPMARTFPKIRRFNLIRDFTTNRLLKGIDLEKDFPNVKIARTLREALTTN